MDIQEKDSSQSSGRVIQTDTRTDAQKIFGDKLLLVARPAEMVFTDYKFLLRGQNYILKRLFRRGPSRRVARMMPINVGYNSPPHLSPLRLSQIAARLNKEKEDKQTQTP